MSVEENVSMKTEKDHVSQLCQNMLEKTADYLNGEVEGVTEDYHLLEKLNVETLKKYNEMKQISVDICSAIDVLNGKYSDLQPYLEMIDHLDDNITSLEQAAYKVDSYSKRLEAKFKQLENS